MTSPGYPSLYDPNDPRQPPLKAGEELAGKYRMDDVLGAGAMGVVVRAWHIELEQAVAIKFLYPEFARNADGAERFRREARSAAKIKNQHVARVLDVGTLEEKNIPYIVMEYLEGCDLAHELRERGPLPVGVAVRYVMQACEAVAEAHERGIVHRDLKPANLFLADGAHGERMIKVLDFGISKVNAAGGAQQFSLTDTATLMGSPAYMSPEQLESSRNVDGRADIWSLGVILHELIVGRVPFNGESVPQLVRSILAGTRATLIERDTNLHRLEVVVARCLCQEREQRFENVSALREALQPFADTSVHPSASMVASREASHRASPPQGEAPLESPSGSAIAGGAGPATSAQTEPTGGGQVPSAWGNTQRGRQRSWQRHGIPLAVLLGLVGVGAYWASNVVSHSPTSSLPPTEGRVSNSQLASTPAPAHTSAPTPAPAAEAPRAAAPAAQPPALPELAPPAEPRAAAPAQGDPAPPAAAEPSQSPPRVRVVPTQPAVAPQVPAPAINAKPKRATTAPEASRPPRAGEAPAAPAPKPAEPVSSDKPKSEPSTGSALDLPDLGGRE